MKSFVLNTAVGVALGFCLSRIGFSSWDEVHRMFVFQDVRLLSTFASAVVVLATAWPLIRRVQGAPLNAAGPVHRGTLLGGLLFGIGWAISGACPSVVWVQLGEGKLGALATIVGIFVGNWAYGAVRTRYLHWDTGSCSDS